MLACRASLDPFGLLGQVLDGHFRVERCVGEGGFSIVYKGTHIGLSEPIAVKCLKLPAALGSAIVDSFVKRFRDESRLQYKLSQGNLYVVRSIASGTTIAPATSALVPYTVLEWLDGRSLATEFDDRRERGCAAARWTTSCGCSTRPSTRSPTRTRRASFIVISTQAISFWREPPPG